MITRARTWLSRHPQAHDHDCHVMVVGSGPRVGELVGAIQAQKHLGVKITGIVDPDSHRIGQYIGHHRVMGMARELTKIVRSRVIDMVVVVVPRSLLNDIRPAIVRLEEMGVHVLIALDGLKPSFLPGWQTEFFGQPFLSLGQRPRQNFLLSLKYRLDQMLAGILLLALSPIFIFIILVLKASSKGKVFIQEERIGRNGRPFFQHKFRGLHGACDFFPQLVNVFWGEMSFVGPKPAYPSEISLYQDWHWKRLTVLPGITCLDRIKGRARTNDFDALVRLDVEYIDHWSWWLDIKIFILTFPGLFLPQEEHTWEINQ